MLDVTFHVEISNNMKKNVLNRHFELKEFILLNPPFVIKIKAIFRQNYFCKVYKNVAVQCTYPKKQIRLELYT